MKHQVLYLSNFETRTQRNDHDVRPRHVDLTQMFNTFFLNINFDSMLDQLKQ